MARAGSADAMSTLRLSIDAASAAGLPSSELGAAIELERRLMADARRAAAATALERALARLSTASSSEGAMLELRAAIEEARRSRVGEEELGEAERAERDLRARSAMEAAQRIVEQVATSLCACRCRSLSLSSLYEPTSPHLIRLMAPCPMDGRAGG